MKREMLAVWGVTQEEKERLAEKGLKLHGKRSASLRALELIKNDVEEQRKVEFAGLVDVSQEEVASKYRVEIRLQNGEYKLLSERAEGRCSINFYVKALLRANLTKTPQFLGDELQLLRESNYELQAISRNLSQLVRTVKELDGGGDEFSLDFEKIKKTIKTHTSKVAKLLASNIDQWDVNNERG